MDTDQLQLPLELIDQPTLPVRDGQQWLVLPGTTWEDIFFPPDTDDDAAAV